MSKKNRKWAHELAPGMVVKGCNPSYRYLVIGLDYEYPSPTQLAFVSIPEYKIQPLRYSLARNYKVLSRKEVKKWERYVRSEQYALDELERDAFNERIGIEQELVDGQEHDDDDMEETLLQHLINKHGPETVEEILEEEDDEIREAWQLELGNQGMKVLPPEFIPDYNEDLDDVLLLDSSSEQDENNVPTNS